MPFIWLAITVPAFGQMNLSPNGGALPAATVGLAYNQPITVTGGTAPYAWLSPSALAGTGLTFSAGGPGNSVLTLSGTPTPSSAGTYNLMVRATDSNTPNARTTGVVNFTLTIGLPPLTITTVFPNANVGVAYGPFTLQSTGGTGTGYTYAVSAGSLPAGITLSAGVIGGSPTTAGTSNFTIRVTDSGSNTATKDFSIAVSAALTITTVSIPSGVVGQSYSAPMAATGGTGTPSWSATGLPGGLTISSATGTISGTPTASGSFSVNVTVTAGTQATKLFTLVIASALSITTNSLPDGTAGLAYTALVDAIGGSGTRVWSATGLPAGLSINTSSGQITGTPTAGGTSTVNVTVTDASGSANKTLTLTVNVALAITTPSLPNGTVGVSYSTTLAATGGTGAKTWSATGLPAGLSIGPTTGIISGTPNAAGTTTVNVTVQDSSGSANRAYTLTINPGLTITTASLPQGTVGQGYSATVDATGGSGTRSWSATGLPAGLTIGTSSGLISGTPTASGTSAVTVTVQDGSLSANKQFQLVVIDGLTITTQALPGGTQGVAYTFTLAATGGTGTRTWTATGLPTGLAVVPSTGVISGTPQATGTFTVTAGVSDTGGGSNSKQLSLIIAAGLTITTSSLPGGVVGTAYQTTLDAAGGSGTRTWSATGLPAGLVINASTGVITGTPTAAGTATVSVSVSDTTGTANRSLSLTIAPPALTITTNSLPNGTVGVGYSGSVQASGGSGTYSWSATGLPIGLTLVQSTGAITGTPTQSGTSTVTFTVSDGSGSANKQISITIQAGLSITTAASLPGATTGASYQITLATSGSIGVVVWGLIAGTLPAGLSLNPSTGVISGTPTAAGTSTFTIQATDAANNATASRAFTLTIGQGLSITTSTLPGGVVGATYGATLAASGGSGTYSWSATGLPPGLSLNQGSGLLSGTPTQANTYSPVFTVSDGSTSANRQISITIAVGLSIITSSALPNAISGVFYQTQLQASGNTGTVTWSATGSLPPGLSLDPSSGILSGTPTTTGTTTFTVQVNDTANGSSTSKQFSLTVTQGLTISTTALPSGRVGSSYSATLQATGGSGIYSWSASGLPPGLALASTGTISGTPTQGGNFGPFFTLSDGANPSVTRQIGLQVTAGLSVQTQVVPNGAVGAAYTTQLTAAGGSGTYTWRVTAGALPPGLQLNSGTGVIAGTPITRSGGNHSFVVEASDGANTATANFSMTILEILTTSLPQLTGQTVQLIASVQSGVLWSLAPASGALPAGVTLQPGGALVGVPTTPGTYTFTIQITWQGLVAQQQYTVTVGGGGTPVTVTTTALPQGTMGTAYSAQLTASGGSGNYLWQLIGGALPAGLTLVATGVISGTPAENGTFNITVRVVDAQSSLLSDVRQLSIGVGSNAFSIVTATIPQATVNTAYTVSLTASGGTAPYSWTVTAGQLPFGIGLTPNTGLLSGTPLLPGSYSFTVRATDTAGAFATRQYVLVVNAGITITTASLPGASLGATYSTQLAATGGTGTGYTWTIISGSLPVGLSLNAQSGVIFGIPSITGSFSVTVQVTDSAGTSTSKPLTLVVGGALTITTLTLPNGATGVPYAQVLSAAGGSPPLTWSVITGNLPPGLQLNSATGQLSGSPLSGGPYNFTVQVRDSVGAQNTRLFNMVITEGLTITTASLPAAVEGIPYSHVLQAAGGTAPYTWTLAVGNLPPGFTLNPNGTISGTPAATANFSFIVQATDAGQQSTTKALTLIVNARTAFVIATALTLPAARVQNPYSVRFQAQGGTPPYVWSLAQGAALPVGLILDPDGNLTGSPTTAGSFSFSVRVSDSAGSTTAQTFNLLITLALGISTQSPLPAATLGSAYAFTLDAAGGQTGYRWSVVSGALPAGLALSESSGLISGTPSAPGTFNFDVRVADDSGSSATASLTLVVRLPSAPTVTITGFGDTVEPAQQPRINVTLGAPFPVAVSGTVTMTFASDAVVPSDDPAVVFSNGRRTAAFTVDAGSTQARFADGGILQTGTVAGTIELTVRLDAGGVDITPSPLPRQVSRVNRAVPVLRSVTARRVASGLEVTLTGFSTSRELRQAVFRFTPVPGSVLQTTEVTVDLAGGAQSWYQSEQSRQFGSQFTLTQQFNVQGDTSAVGSVTVTMSNGQGTSAAATANF